MEAKLYEPRSGTHWYAARVRWGCELSVVERVASDLAIEGYAPQFRMDEEIIGAAFPSYAFFAFDTDIDGWQRINDDRHVVKLLPLHSVYPVDLPSAFIGWVQGLEERGEFTVRGVRGRLVLKYRPGDVVPVTRGAWAGLPAKFVQQVKDNVELLVRIFGHERTMTVPVDQVQAT
jgi:transcription antitermination factor NusG